MSRFIGFLAATLFIASGLPALAQDTCTYTIKQLSSQMEWTGFKTTEKVAVKGTFGVFQLEDMAAVSSVPAILSSLKFKIDTATVQTGDVARDGIIANFFFKRMIGPATITGSIEKVTGDDSKGTAQVRLHMNSETALIPMSYKVDAKGKIVATGQLDILGDFGAGQAMSSLNAACHKEHKGKDGVSKTWSQVKLQASAQLNKNCPTPTP